jgi:4-amino-4-deoxy-L-arabinose transferase-like glycosyltransferase
VLYALRPHTASIGIALAAIAIAWFYAATVLRYTRPFGLPLDDSYIYLTYAKQMGRGQPFTYYPGGGYSAGSTSVLWPMVLAPFWTLGARGHALVWVSFGLCSALFAATAVLCQLVVRDLVGRLAGVLAGVMIIVIGPFVFTALSGMEVALASALLAASIYLLAHAERTGRPRKLLVACLAATALSRPEALLIVGIVVGVCAVQRLAHRDWRAALWWLSPLVAPLVWLTANRVFAGHWAPNTGVAKSHFYLPGFDWTYWTDTVIDHSRDALTRFFYSNRSPFVWPRFVWYLWLAGAFRIAWWAKRERRYLVGTLLVIAPFLLVFAVIASSGAWVFHAYRYIAPAFPLLLIPVAIALAPPQLPERFAWRQWAVRGWNAVAVGVVALFVRAAMPNLADQAKFYAQNAADLNEQVVKIGHYIRAKLPNASIMFHDAGAIAYYGDTRVNDLLGLVTNRQATIAPNGPGARFEFLENLPVDQRPTHFAYYPVWMGQREFFGETVVQTQLARTIHKQRLIGGTDMQLIVANFDHVHTAERPLEVPAGWHLVDRLDSADMDSEAAHGWSGNLGRRTFDTPSARWSFVHKQTEPMLLIDGGRTIIDREQFTLAVDPAKPVRLVLRTGGAPGYELTEPLEKPATVRIFIGDREVGSTTVPLPRGRIVELPFELAAPGGPLTIRTASDAPYRVMHWFALQPD